MALEPTSDQDGRRGILSGIRVVDMTSVLFGAFATQMLGDLGADVIKVEAPGRRAGDMLRYAGKPQHTPAQGPLFQHYNRNKRSILIDAGAAEQKQALIDLVASADLFISNVRSKSLVKLGLCYEDLRAVRPDIVYVHCAGFGSGGVYADYQAYDDLIQAAAGAADLLPRLDGNPAPRYIPSQIADKSSGLYAAFAAVSALLHRERTGEGQFVEVPMLECFTHFNMSENLYGHTFVPPTGNVGYSRVFNAGRRPFETKDGYMAILPHSDAAWDTFFELAGRGERWFTGHPDFGDPRGRKPHVAAIYSAIEAAARTRTTDEWIELLTAHNVPCMKVNRLHEVMSDPHLTSVDFFEHRQHPTEGEYISLKHPINFSRTPAKVYRDPPGLGQHTKELIGEVGADPAASTHPGED